MPITQGVKNMTNIITIKRAGCELNVDLDDMPQTIKALLMAHGLVQKVGDAAANVGAQLAAEAAGERWAKMDKADKRAAMAKYTGDTANLETIRKAAEVAMLKVVDALKADNWGVQRTAGATGLGRDAQEIAEYLRNNKTRDWAKIIKDYAEMTTVERLVAIFTWFEAQPADWQAKVSNAIAAQKALAGL